MSSWCIILSFMRWRCRIADVAGFLTTLVLRHFSVAFLIPTLLPQRLSLPRKLPLNTILLTLLPPSLLHSYILHLSQRLSQLPIPRLLHSLFRPLSDSSNRPLAILPIPRFRLLVYRAIGIDHRLSDTDGYFTTRGFSRG